MRSVLRTSVRRQIGSAAYPAHASARAGGLLLCLVLAGNVAADEGTESRATLRRRVAMALYAPYHGFTVVREGKETWMDPLAGVVPAGSDEGALVLEVLESCPIEPRSMNSFCRERALEWLEAKRDPRAKAVILRVFERDFATAKLGLQASLCVALGKLCGEEGRAILERVATSPEADLRHAAVLSMIVVGPAALPTLERIAREDPVPGVRWDAACNVERIREQMAEAAKPAAVPPAGAATAPTTAPTTAAPVAPPEPLTSPAGTGSPPRPSVPGAVDVTDAPPAAPTGPAAALVALALLLGALLIWGYRHTRRRRR